MPCGTFILSPVRRAHIREVNNCKSAGRKPTAIGLGDYGLLAAGRLPIGCRLPTCPAKRQAANDAGVRPELHALQAGRLPIGRRLPTCPTKSSRRAKKRMNCSTRRQAANDNHCRRRFSGDSGRPILTIGRRFCQPAPQCGKPQTHSHRPGRLGAARGRPINNRPQVTNLPHVASAICLRWYRIVAAREAWNELWYKAASRNRRSHSSGTVGAAGRPIANRPQVANLPHIASATYSY
jgi:hypothetical protein